MLRGGGRRHLNYALSADYLLFGYTRLPHPTYRDVRWWANSTQSCFSYFVWVVDKDMTGRFYGDRFFTTFRWFTRLIPALTPKAFKEVLSSARVGGTASIARAADLFAPRMLYGHFDDFMHIMRRPYKVIFNKIFGDLAAVGKAAPHRAFLRSAGAEIFFERTREPLFF